MSALFSNAFYQELRAMLKSAGINNPLEARVIFESAIGFDPRGEKSVELDPLKAEKAKEFAKKRMKGYPLQYIAGSWPFLDFSLELGEGVLIPRAETEDVALRAISLLESKESPRVIDLCSGSGCLAIAIMRAKPGAAVSALEKSADAFVYLERNIETHAPRVNAVLGDVFCYQDDLKDNSLDLIVSNPPYVRFKEYGELQPELYFEPKQALVGGEDGLDFYRHIVAAYYPKLKSGGLLLFEVGFDQAEEVAAVCAKAGYRNIKKWPDRYSKNRMVEAEK